MFVSADRFKTVTLLPFFLFVCGVLLPCRIVLSLFAHNLFFSQCRGYVMIRHCGISWVFLYSLLLIHVKKLLGVVCYET